MSAAAEPLLVIRNLKTWFSTRAGVVKAVDGVDLYVMPGECLSVVGESGSGKSVTFLSVIGLVRPPGRVEAGEVLFDGRDLLKLPEPERRSLRGRDIAVTMQDALTALNPALTARTQINEVLLAHGKASGQLDASRQAVEMLRLVGIPAPERRLDDYPHQFSGGMRQRIMIAIALACRPRLLIADEPTTALDVTIQAQVLELIARLREELGMSVVLVTHDLGVVAEYADRVAVMYAGEIVETGPTADVIERPLHPYTVGLLESIPRLDRIGADLRPIAGQVPDLAHLPRGCRFAGRCALRRDACEAGPIALRRVASGRDVRCIAVAQAGAA